MLEKSALDRHKKLMVEDQNLRAGRHPFVQGMAARTKAQAKAKARAKQVETSKHEMGKERLVFIPEGVMAVELQPRCRLVGNCCSADIIVVPSLTVVANLQSSTAAVNFEVVVWQAVGNTFVL